jgi:hypothetical protein
MSSEPPSQGPAAGVSTPSARHEELALAAYHEALGEFSACGQSRRLLLEQLGDVDRQATHPLTDARLALAGRLIAAAQVAEPVRLPAPQVHGVVRAWLANRATERDDAAPAVSRRVAPEEERVHGLTQKLTSCQYDAGFSRTAWGIAGMVLQYLIRPTVEVSRALDLGDALEPLAAAALARAGQPAAAPAAGGDQLHARLAAAAVRSRAVARIVTSRGADRRRRHDAWLAVAADTVQGHASWSDAQTERSMAQALARATERLASSLVPEEPARFDHAGALEHAVQAAFDAAVTTLAVAVQPADSVFVHGTADILDTLMEAASSALIGAWVVEHEPA